MVFFKVDDGMWGHPKFAALSPEAVTLWVTAGSWCGRYMTDGAVPSQRLLHLRGTDESAQELVSADLWDVTPEGWRFHDWDHYQYTKDEVEERRAKDRVKKRRDRTATQEVLVAMTEDPKGPNFGAAYADAFKAAHGELPPRVNIARAAREAKALIAEGKPEGKVMEACKNAAEYGMANVATAYGIAASNGTRKGARPSRSAAKVDEVAAVMTRAAERDAARERKGIE